MTVATTEDTFFEEWMLSSEAKKRIELHIYYPYLDEGSCNKMIFYDSYLIHHKTVFSSDNNKPMIEELKITCAGIKTPNSKIEYETTWRKTFERKESSGTNVKSDKKPKLLELHMEDLEHNLIEKEDIREGQEVYLVIKSRDTKGVTVKIDIANKLVDYKYKGEWMENDIITGIVLNENLTRVKLEVVKQR